MDSVELDLCAGWILFSLNCAGWILLSLICAGWILLNLICAGWILLSLICWWLDSVELDIFPFFWNEGKCSMTKIFREQNFELVKLLVADGLCKCPFSK